MPAAALSQQRQRRDPRATVATVARLHDYLRLLFARIGPPHCTACGEDSPSNFDLCWNCGHQLA